MAADIHSVFRGLYNIDSTPSPEASLAFSANIHTYIASSGMRSLSSSVQEQLESPFTEEELCKALTQSKPKKALGSSARLQDILYFTHATLGNSP